MTESPTELSSVRHVSSYDAYFDGTASSSDGESFAVDASRQRVHRSSSLNMSPSKNVRHAPRSSTNDDTANQEVMSCVCVVCANDVVHESARVVPRRHVIFPLSIISFFSSHPPGSRYVDVVGSSKDQTSVPEFIQLMDPEMTLDTFNVFRREEEWLSEPLFLCDACTDGLRDVVASLQLERDGSILVPKPQRTAAPATSGRVVGKPPRAGLPPERSSSTL
jgi:hypothetical protein